MSGIMDGDLGSGEPIGEEPVGKPEPQVVQEIEALRDAHSNTYLLDDGSYRTVISAAAINYETEPGKWTAIDAIWTEQAPESPYGYESERAPLLARVRRSDGGLEVEGYGEEIILVPAPPEGSKQAAPGFKLSEDRKTLAIADLLPGVDLALEHRGTLIKSTMTVKSAEAPASLEFGMVRAPLDEAKPVEGALVVHKPDATDADALPVGVVMEEQPDRLCYAWDKAAAASGALAYPIEIDPTIGPPSQDAFIYSTGSTTSSDQSQKILIKFDIASIPDNATITAATLDLYMLTKAGSGSATVKRGNNQTWTKDSTVATLNGIALGAQLDSKLISNLTTSAYNSWVVRYGSSADGFEADLVGANQYFTGVFEATAGSGTPSEVSGTNAALALLVRGTAWDNFKCNATEAGSNMPTLTVTYTTPKSSVDSGTGAEASQLDFASTQADSAAGSEAAELAEGYASADDGAGDEIAAVLEGQSDADNATGNDLMVGLHQCYGEADSGVAAEAQTLATGDPMLEQSEEDDLAVLMRRW